MILADKEIRKLIDNNKIIIEPSFDQKNIRPVGIRFHLGESLLVPVAGQTVDLTEPTTLKYDDVKIDSKGYILKPNEFVLGHTLERIQVPRNMVLSLDGRSTVARIGLSVHCTAHIGDGNFERPNSITLEMKNEGNFNIVLKPGVALGMFVIHELSGEIEQNLQTQYKVQDRVLPPDLINQLK